MGWCHVKLLLSQRKFWVHHSTMHQFTVSLHSKLHRLGSPYWPLRHRPTLLLNIHRGDRPIRGGDKWEKGDSRVKPWNRWQPRRPRLLWTATRTTGCYGSVRQALHSDHRTTQLLSQLLCRTVTKSVRSSAVGKQLKQKKSNSPAQLHLLALDLFWASFFVRVQLTCFLLISPGLCLRGTWSDA